MSWFKKLLPYIIGGGLGALGFWFFGGEEKIAEVAETFVESPQIEITEESEPEQIYCPPVNECPPTPECKPQIKYKTVYRDRVIHVPQYKEPGCYANWATGEHEAKVGNGVNLKCVYDNVKRTMKTYFTMPNGQDGTLRRGRP